jgi:hypothetical protein
MSPTRRIKLLHVGLMAWFVTLMCEAFWWQLAPAWAGLIGVSALYGSMWLEARWVRDLLDRFGDVVTPRTHTAVRSMLMTRMFIAALSIVVVAAEVGRLGQ